VERIRKGRSLSLSQEREKGNGDGRSEKPGRSSATRVDTSSRRHGRNGDSKTKVKTRAPDRDFLKLIPNFDSMTPAEKVKAKMKLQLSETGVSHPPTTNLGVFPKIHHQLNAIVIVPDFML
jgi:hypothetical protein